MAWLNRSRGPAVSAAGIPWVGTVSATARGVKGLAWSARVLTERSVRAAPDHWFMLMLSRNMMLFGVFRSLPSSNSIASTGGTPTRARRSTAMRWYSSG